jgi:hypothetical protein
MEEPDVLPGDEFYLEAFWDLSTCRASGMGIGSIPWRDIVFYADYMRLEPDIKQVFVPTIRAMDAVFLEHMDKKQQTSSGKSSSGKRRPKGLKGRRRRRG